MTLQPARRPTLLAGLFVALSALLVLFGPLHGFDGADRGSWSTVWGDGSAARWLVLLAALAAIGALAAFAVARRSIAVPLAWLAVVVAVPMATSVGVLLVPALVVVLVLLMRGESPR